MKKINYINSIIVIALVLVMSSCTKNNYKYQKTVEESLEIVNKIDLLPVTKLAEILITEDTVNYQFVDIRTPHEYANGHLQNAISLPFKSLNKELEDVFCNNNRKLLVYGENASQARLACLYLKQIGIENVTPVGGGYEFIYKNIINSFAIHKGTYDDEIAKYDYKKVIEETPGVGDVSTSPTAPPPTTIVVPQKKTGSVGGCE